MLDVEVQLRDFILFASWNDCEPKPESEACLKIYTAAVTCIVGHDKSRPPDFGHYFVADPADVILRVDAERTEPSRANSRVETVCPSISQAFIERHSDETLCRIGAGRLQCFSGQNPSYGQSSRRSVASQIFVTKKDPLSEE
jgi:hypothetical protein